MAGDVHSDAVVSLPVLGSHRGVALTSALYPRYGDIDPYAMATAAVDTAVRNLVAVGTPPGRLGAGRRKQRFSRPRVENCC